MNRDKQFDLNHGRIQPQAVDLEEAVLGAILLEKDAIVQTLEILNPESFYKEANHKIYEICLELFNNSEPIDLLTVINSLKNRGLLEISGGAFYLSTLTDKVASASNIEFHSRIIAQKHIQREIIRSCTESIISAYSDEVDVLELLSAQANSVSNLLATIENSKTESTTDTINEIVNDVSDAQESTELIGIPTPLKKINKRYGGWQNSDLIILAARPAMGKTSLMLQFATFPVFFHDKRVLVFSLEMSRKQLVARILGQELNIKANRFTRDAREMNLEEMNQKLGEHGYVYNNKLIIDDRAGLDISQVIAKSKSIALKEGLDLIVFDYMQLASDRSIRGSREQEISSISRKLKVLAKDLNIPIIALSQLSRAVESRGGDRRPQLSDLRESGSIEQDADAVLFINRPEYYGLTEDADGNSTLGVASIITAKYRGGGVGEDTVKWKPEYTRFEDQQEEYEESFSNLEPSDDF